MLRFILRLGLGAALLGIGACKEQPPESPLIHAARTGSVDTIKLLLESGADVNMPGPTDDDWDATPLQHAILARQSGAVRLLLERGADPNRVAAPNSPAPLLLAAGDADPTFVNLLLAHGANPTVEDESGVTPLARAVSAGTIHGPDRPMFGGCRVDTVRALLAHDPTLRLKRNAAMSDAIWWARFQRCGDVLKLIGEEPTTLGQLGDGTVALQRPAAPTRLRSSVAAPRRTVAKWRVFKCQDRRSRIVNVVRPARSSPGQMPP